MSSGLRFVSHACVLLEGDHGDLLMDPWFFGRVFNGSWELVAPPDLDTLDLGGLRHVWVSHQHPDHFHLPTLAWVRDRVDGPLTAFVRRSPNPAVGATMADLGFDVVELREGVEHRVADDLAVTLFTAGEDSALVLCRGDRVIVNQNDATLAERTLRRIKRRFPDIDVWLYQSSITGTGVNADDTEGLERTRRAFLDYLLGAHAILRPRTFVPFASFVRYARRENAHANELTVTPGDLVEDHPELPVQVPWPGEELTWAPSDEANRRNVARWADAFAAPFEPRPTPAVDDGALQAAGDALVRAAAGAGPAETHVAVAETGRAAAFDFPRRRFRLLDEPDPARLAARMPGHDLHYFCANPYGANVGFTGCVHVHDPGRWGALVGFRESLEPGNGWGPVRRLRGRLGRWEAELAGGRIRAARHRLRARLR